MNPAESELCIESLDGHAHPAALYLNPGVQLGPIQIGTQGKWRITAEGVADEHALLFYDGEQLFLQSVDATTPVVAGGRPVPSEWTPIEPPCNIELGSARLWFGPAEDVDVDTHLVDDPDSEDELPTNADETRLVSVEGLMESVARHRASSGLSVTGIPAPSIPGAPPSAPRMPGPPPSAPGSAPYSNPYPGPPSSAPFTSAPPLPDLSAPEPPPPPSIPTPPSFRSQPSLDLPPLSPSAPSAPTPPSMPSPITFDAPPASIPTPASIGDNTPPTQQSGAVIDMGMAPVTPKPKPSMWSGMSFPQKATAVLFLPMVASVIVIFTDVGNIGAPKPMASNVTTAAASVSATAAPPPSATATETEVADDGAGGEAAGEGGAGPLAVATDASASETTGQATAPPAPKKPTRRKKKKKGETLQRKAVDAVAAASYEEAARLYEELAKQYPDNEAYAAAAAITRAKAQHKRPE